METRKEARPRLTVAMIVRDEADVLADTIASVRSLADEIVVFDTGSVDQTPEIARRLGAIVTRGTWSDDFSAARNRTMALATGRWVLWLDGGEEIDPSTAELLREFVDKSADRNCAYGLMVEIPALERGNSNQQAVQIRLVPNSSLLRFEGRVRETLRPSLEAGGYSLGQAPGRIFRHPREHDVDRKVCRAQRNLHLAVLEAEQLGHYPTRLLLALGDAYADLGSRPSARDAYLQALAQSEPRSLDVAEAYYGLLATMDAPEDQSLQLSTCLESLEIFPLDAQLLMAMGNCMQGHRRYDLAARAFELAVRHGQVFREIWHLTELMEVAASCWSLTLRLQGKDDDARRALEETLTFRPESERLRLQLLDLLAKQGLQEEALRLLDRLPIAPEHLPAMREAIAGACAAASGEWTRALGHLQSAYVAGCKGTFCLRWLATTLLSNGQIEAAAPVLREWQQLDPNNPELLAYMAIVSPEGAASQPAGTARPDQTPGRRLRVDPAQPLLALPVATPIVTQATSADAC